MKVPLAAIVALVNVESVPEPGPRPPHAAGVHRVTVWVTLVEFVHLTPSPSLTICIEGLKQNSVPPQPVDVIVTLAGPAAEAIDVANTMESASPDTATAAHVASLRTFPP